MCTVASDPVSLFEGSRLSNPEFGSWGDFCFTASSACDILNEKRKEEAVAGQP